MRANATSIDPGGHLRPGVTVDTALETIGAEEAFDTTLDEVAKALIGFELLEQAYPGGAVGVAIDLASLSEIVLAGLCARWISAGQGEVARNSADVPLGLAPAVHGSFLRTMETWIDDKILWACQQRLAEVSPKGISPFDRACQALRRPLLETMRERPIPEALWRCPVVGTGVLLGLIAGLLDAGTLRSTGSPVRLMLTPPSPTTPTPAPN